MYEVEVKVRADLARVREHLDATNAEALGVVTQHDTYYAHPVRSFAETDEALRIRREDDQAALTYKGPRIDRDSKTRREIETDIADADAAGMVLEALAFEPVARVRKERERYLLASHIVSLDTVEGLGEFVEVEAKAEEDEFVASRTKVYEIVEELGLDPASQLRASYLELIMEGGDRLRPNDDWE